LAYAIKTQHAIIQTVHTVVSAGMVTEAVERIVLVSLMFFYFVL